MPRTRRDLFTTIRSEGALLPTDLLQRIAEGDRKVLGLTPEAYHLAGNEKLNEVASRSWNRLLGMWAAFQAGASSLKPTDAGTGFTRDKWLLPLFQELGYGRLPVCRTLEVGGKPYAISHVWYHTPIHLVGRNVDLDHRTPGVAGAARTSPHGLLQEFLNRSEEHVWGFLSNGLKLRIVRENKSLTRRAHVEFDLASMMDGQVYSDFALLWLLCHQSRVEADQPAQCWLEKWAEEARQEGTRALDTLRDGVEKAIEVLGRGFLGHPANGALVEKLRPGSLSTQDYYRQLLRAVYRLIFLFVAEDRDLLLTAPRGSKERERYLRYYSMDRIRSLAERRRGTPHGDLWQGLFLVFQKLGSDSGCPELGLPALGSYLWSPETIPDLDCCALANAALLEAIRSLAFTVDAGIRRVIDFRNLGPEELGSIYESLLELHPDLNADSPTFALKVAAGHERKTSGSYYTHDSLVQCLLDSALEPVMDEAVKVKTPEDAAKALLALKICDLAVGSGHFLIAAAHRLARRVAAIRTGDEEPSPEAARTALRDVIGHCLYGVDLNPMAAELCRVNLWLEALEPGKPLSFLDHHIRVGNSLLGTTPELIAAGLPDEAFAAIGGDDKKVCSASKKRNKQEREGQRDMVHLMVAEPRVEYNSFEARTRGIEEAPDNTIDEIQHKAEQFHRLIVSPDYQHAQRVADTWCAAFVWGKQANAALEATTTDTIRRLQADPNALTPAQHREVERLLSQYKFFHWHLVFPEVFARGGFDCVLGNPPWERVKLQEKEWFAARNPEIANAPNSAARKRLIEALKASDPALYQEFVADSRKAEGESHFLRNSGRYPLCGRGDINLYAVFAEGMRTLLSNRGLVGCVLPTGIATDDTTKFFFQDVVETKSLASLYDFENKGIFPGVHSSYKFCLFTVGRGLRPTAQSAEFVFFAHAVGDLSDPERRFTLSVEDIALLNPTSLTCPVVVSRRDAELLKHIHRNVPALGGQVGDGEWRIQILQKMIDVTIHAKFCSFTADPPEPDWLPVYEGRTLRHYNHRATTYRGVGAVDRENGNARELSVEELSDPGIFFQAAVWVHRQTFIDRLGGRSSRVAWFPSVRYVTNTTNEQTVITGIRPFLPSNNKLSSLFLEAAGAGQACFVANFSSFIFDYVARQKVGGTTLGDYIIEQLPTLTAPSYMQAPKWGKHTQVLRDWLLPRVVELTYTAWDLEHFSQDCGWSGPPFRWDEERRFLLRCELDAAFFHLYLLADDSGGWRQAEGETVEDLARLKGSFPTPRDAVSYIMDTFPIVKRKDESKYDGDYRTKRVILEIYDAMQESIRTGHPYQTRLDPPPADSRCCHPPKEVA